MSEKTKKLQTLRAKVEKLKERRIELLLEGLHIGCKQPLLTLGLSTEQLVLLLAVSVDEAKQLLAEMLEK